jgi:hypothetical protein
MPTLPPTVHERVAACNTRIFVNGIAPGADVQIEAGPNSVSETVTSSSRTFTVPELDAGDVIRARQDAGSGFSAWSPEVVVEEVELPPNSAPQLPAGVGVCSHCVRVGGLVPGCDVELLVGPEVVGSGTANKDGNTCVNVDFQRIREEGTTLRARATVCGQQSPDGTTQMVAEPFGLPTPDVKGPLFGCQTSVLLGDVHPGARVRLRTTDGTDLASLCSCGKDVNVGVGVQLDVGDEVQAQTYWAGQPPCRDESAWSDGEEVVPPDGRIEPTVCAPLIEGHQCIRVKGQIQGAELVVKVRPSAGAPAVEYDPRAASENELVALAERLEPGNVVSVVQTLCGESMESEAVTVLPLPSEVYQPVILPPVSECARKVQVSNLYPGASVQLYQNGIPASQKVWAGTNTSVGIEPAPSLFAGAELTAKQFVGSMESDHSESVQVEPAEEPLEPVIMEPVTLGATEVMVSQVTPGSRVTVESASGVIGETYASEPVVRVPVSPVTGTVFATASLCEFSTRGERVAPIKDPCDPGGFTEVDEEFRDYGYMNVDATPDSDPFEAPIKGQLYYPAGPDGGPDPDAGPLPLVIIAHGQWFTGNFWPESVDGEMLWTDDTGESEPVNSYLGYDYLARHLAGWGAIVFSLHLDWVSNRTMHTPDEDSHLYARGEIILEAIKRVSNDPELANFVNDDRVGLVGHSMGGEGVVLAQHLNETDDHGLGIRGIVSIAPTQWRDEVTLMGTSYLQLYGSMDTLLSSLGSVTDEDAEYSGFRIYDRAWRPKTHAWIHGARHNPFNRRWVNTTDLYETEIATKEGVISNHDHEEIARCLINAFFRDTLGDQPAYGGYLEGTILPPSLSEMSVFLQHSSDSGREVVDNFGDGDEQAGIPQTGPSKAENSLNESVAATGDGLAEWDDVQHVDLQRSPHETIGVELGWDEPDAEYTSRTGGVSHPPDKVLSLRGAQFDPEPDLNFADLDMDCFVRIEDGDDVATVRLGAVHTLPYPHKAHQSLSVLRTVRLPLNAFRAVNDDVALNDIRAVSLLLGAQFTGRMLVDDIEFSH